MGILNMLRGVKGNIASHVAAQYERDMRWKGKDAERALLEAEAKLARLQQLDRTGQLTHVSDLWFSWKETKDSG